MGNTVSQPSQPLPPTIQVDNDAVINISNIYKWLERNQSFRQKPLVIVTNHSKLTNEKKIELKKAMCNLVHENRIIFFENHLDLTTDLPSDKNQTLDLVFQKIELENMKCRPQSTHTNILVLGPQHSGKSSLINTLYKFFNQRIKVEICDVGRNAEVGTIYYEKILLGKKNNHDYFIFDTAGKPFEKGMDGNDMEQVQKLIYGLRTGVNLSISEWMSSPIADENAVGFVLFVVSAEVLTKILNH